MFVPFITNHLNTLSRRKGGGGKGGGRGRGRGGGGGGGKSSISPVGGGSKASDGSAGGAGGVKIGSGSSRSSSFSSGGSTVTAKTYGQGGGGTHVIPSGVPFAGRESGGGTRSEVFGTRSYGSGYPNTPGRGVAGRGFPFVFWPVPWGYYPYYGYNGAYLHNEEYGRCDNTSRPGGIMMTAEFTSQSPATTFRVFADNTTIQDLIIDIAANCTILHLYSPSTVVAMPYKDSLASPKPEQAIQYYRASSVALTLDGYNNTAALGPEGETDTPLPTNIDMTLLDCLNQTIAAAVPLVGGSVTWSAPPSYMPGLVGIVYLIWTLASLV